MRELNRFKPRETAAREGAGGAGRAPTVSQA
jgi:hypothetical protein